VTQRSQLDREQESLESLVRRLRAELADAEKRLAISRQMRATVVAKEQTRLEV
jgi:hypothetical protein